MKFFSWFSLARIQARIFFFVLRPPPPPPPPPISFLMVRPLLCSPLAPCIVWTPGTGYSPRNYSTELPTPGNLWILKAASETKWHKCHEIYNLNPHFGPFFVIVRNGIYYKGTRFVHLIQMMYLLFAISLKLQAVIESFYSNEKGKYCENETGRFFFTCRGVTFRMYRQLVDYACCLRNPWVTARGGGGGVLVEKKGNKI